jgi:peptidyl-prolyl cis-trans isomerase C
MIAAGGALAQIGPDPERYGLPAPDPRIAASLDDLLAALAHSPDLVVADVGADTVTWGDIADSLHAMPRVVLGIPFEQLYQTATLQVMARKALAQVAASHGVDNEAAVARRMRSAAEDVLASEYLRRSLQPAVSDEALRPVYEREVAPKIIVDEVRARIIMVTSSEEACGLIAQLDAGADFGELAMKYSKDGTAPQGGDLGFVRLQALAPELGAVIFALAPGQIARYPVRSGAWWFVVRVEGRNQKGAPAFAQAREDLGRDVMNARIPELKLAAMREVDVKFRDVPSPPGGGQDVLSPPGGGQARPKVANTRVPAGGADR